MKRKPATKTLWEGKFLAIKSRKRWEFADRPGTTGIVVIVPVTSDEELLLVEQYRPPVDARVIELPAGLAGDLADARDESLQTAAERELLEEAGYAGGSWKSLTSGPPSAGLSSEVVTFFLADGVTRQTDGGGDASEDIQVHRIPLASLPEWLETACERGAMVDPKVYAGLYFLTKRKPKRRRATTQKNSG